MFMEREEDDEFREEQQFLDEASAQDGIPSLDVSAQESSCTSSEYASTSTSTNSSPLATASTTRREIVSARKQGWSIVLRHNIKIYIYFACLGRKRKRTDNEELAEILAKINDRADERAAEREERLRLKELEMEERRMERENRHEERIFSMFAAILERTNANNTTGLYYQ